MKELKLYVWEDFASDYSEGVAFAFATSKKEAVKLIAKGNGYIADDLNNSPYRIVEEKEGFLFPGGS